MKKNQRTIQYFDLGITGKTLSRHINGPVPAPRNLQDLMTEFEILRELNLARKKVSSRTKQEYRLEHMEELEDCWVLLLNVVDPEAAHPVTQKINGSGDDRQVMDLGSDRGLESSSHVIIFKEMNDAHKHLVLVEKCSELPYLKVISFLNHLCRITLKVNREKYTYPDPSGVAGKTIRKYCWLTLHGHPSDEFKGELEQGVITSIKLTSDMSQIRGYDSNSQPELIGTEIKMNVSRISVLKSGGNWNHLQKAISYADTLNSPKVRISFTDLTGASHTTILSSDSGDLLDADKYVKKSKIGGFNDALRTAFPIIHEGIRDRMLGLVKI